MVNRRDLLIGSAALGAGLLVGQPAEAAEVPKTWVSLDAQGNITEESVAGNPYPVGSMMYELSLRSDAFFKHDSWITSTSVPMQTLRSVGWWDAQSDSKTFIACYRYADGRRVEARVTEYPNDSPLYPYDAQIEVTSNFFDFTLHQPRIRLQRVDYLYQIVVGGMMDNYMSYSGETHDR